MADFPQIDFSPIGDLANVYQRARQNATREQVLSQLGQGAGPLDYGSAAKQLLAAGDTQGGLSLAHLADAAANRTQAQSNADRAYELQRVAQQEKPTFGVIGKDSNGNDVHGFIDLSKRTTAPVNAQGVVGADGLGSNAGLTGDAFLQTLDQGRANQIKAIADGRMSPPGGMSLKSPQIQGLMRDVAQYEPGFDLTSWSARNKTHADLASGKMGQNIASFNTTIQHLETLDKAASALGNTWSPGYNTVKNFVGSQLGNPEVNQFNIAKTAVADELTRAFRGTGGNVHDLMQWEAAINNAGSPAQLKAAIKQSVELLRGRIESVGDQYSRGMGKTTDPLTLLSPKAASGIRRLSGEPEPEAPSPAPTPKPEANAWRTQANVAAARANPQETINQARAAMANGMSPQEAAQRLAQIGIDPRMLTAQPGFASPEQRQ